MRRNPRSFIAVRWSLLEGFPGVNLLREARRLGFSPSLGFDSVGGVHYKTQTGMAVAFTHPPEPNPSLAARALTLIGAKHAAVTVESVAEDALPASIESARKKLRRESYVSLWPAEEPNADPLPVVVEYASGGFLHRCLLDSFFVWAPPAYDLTEAAIFENAEEARDWLDQREIHVPVALRYVTAAQAEQDQRDAALSP